MAPLPPTRERPLAFGTAPGEAIVKRPSALRRAVRLLFFVIAIVVALGLGAAAAAVFLTKHEVNKLLTPKTADTRAAAKQLTAPLPGQPANILIMGSDHRSGFDANDRRSDTLLLMRLDPKRGTASVISFPRDLYVNIPGHGQDKINDAFSLGGPKLTVDTVKDLTGLDINYIMVVDFKGFRDIVNSFGGVYVDVDRHYFNDNSQGGDQYATIDVPEGYQLLHGRDALDYARFRHTDSDFHRIARQQQVVAALKKQVTGSKIAGNIGGLFDILYKNTDMATGGNGRISTSTVYSYLRLALDHKKGKFVYNVEVEGDVGTTAGGASIVVADPTKIKEAVNAFLAPDEAAQARTADELTGTKGASSGSQAEVKSPAAAPKLPIEVKNGNGIGGSAGQAAVTLRGQGYDVLVQTGSAGNADNQSYATTRVQYKAAADKPTADAVAALLPGATVEPISVANATARRILVIVGKNAGASTSATTGGVVVDPSVTADSNKVPKQTKAAVTVDPTYGLDEFQALARGAHMPVVYPATREQNSTYDFPTGGVRSYQIVDTLTGSKPKVYRAYRIVARTGGGDYWGLQGTKWPNPPLLEEPTRSLTKGGRTFDLYFNGTQLHLVAWHQYGATYWVSNSVLDKLSNETMLAIAEGTKLVPSGSTSSTPTG